MEPATNNDEAFFWELLQLLSGIKRCLAETAPDYGLTVGQALTLCHLREDSPRTMSRLAKHLGCDPSVITDYADRLVKAGYVTRTESPTDRRSKQLALTAPGKATRRQLIGSAVRQALRGLEHITPEARTDLLTQLRALADAPSSAD